MWRETRREWKTWPDGFAPKPAPTIDVLRADLTVPADLHAVEARLRDDARITLLVNNAGAGDFTGFSNPDLDAAEKLIALNITAVTRLTGAVVPRFLASGGGSIINVGSVLGFAPEALPGVYSSTKAFVLTFSQSLQLELGPRGIYVQALLPSATRTEIWERGGRSVDSVPNAMDVGELVDAALVAFDRKELITLPSLPDQAQWDAFNAARLAMLPNLRQKHAAEISSVERDRARRHVGARESRSQIQAAHESHPGRADPASW